MDQVVPPVLQGGDLCGLNGMALVDRDICLAEDAVPVDQVYTAPGGGLVVPAHAGKVHAKALQGIILQIPQPVVAEPPHICLLYTSRCV